MKLATYVWRNEESYGVVREGGVFDVPSRLPSGPRSVLELLQAGQEAIDELRRLAEKARKLVPLEQVRLLAPMPNPPKVIGLAVNYVEHHREFSRGHDMPDDPRRSTTPRPFIMPQTAILGPGAEIPWPTYSRQIDYEIELAVVVGKPCKCVPPARAGEFIAGYTIANDVSARGVTHAEGRTPRPKDDFFDWLHGKWADGFCPIGPYLVTADEVGDPMNLHLELAVNDEVRQKASTAQMIHNVFEVVSFISHLMTLLPGDIIATGTPSGVGMATGKLLKGGDRIACRIERIGELTNTLGQPPVTFYTPCKV
jgi:2-keto-4-pentenoate hydratase/2-oxohepta-3-ene-1,7-dioic acid hydratase in catechol pathway